MESYRKGLFLLLLVSSSLFANSPKENFISKLSNTIEEVKDSLNGNSIASKIPTSLVIAQAGLESGWGKSNYAKEKNNYFGMKGRKGFAEFDDMSDSVESYLKNLATHRAYKKFQKAIENGEQDPNKLITIIANAYSGNEGKYASQIKSIILSNDLTEHDKKVFDS